MKYIFHVDFEDIPLATRTIKHHLKQKQEHCCMEYTLVGGEVQVYASKRNKDSYSVWRI